MNNIILALGSPSMMERHIAWDEFKDMLVIAGADRPFGDARWRSFKDTDYALVRQHLEVKGFKPMGMELLKLGVLAVAEANSFDTASEWLRRLAWDGEERVDTFAFRGWGWADTPYARAVGRYTWTGLAGRIIQPGVQADMVPVLVGPQGQLKTSAIKAMSPDPDFYASVKLDAHDADTSRLLRGTLIAELEELRGLNSRAIEEIKAWMSKTHEKWVPKYREFASTYGRRNLFFGTTNEDEFLADPTGERRMLPGNLVRRADPDWIARHRDQLWAEGAALFTLDGVDWLEAESLARAEHAAFKVSDPWEPYIAQWLIEGSLDVGGGRPGDQEYLTTGDILAGAIHLPSGQIDRGKETRAGKVMKALGWHRRRVPVTIEGEDKRIWAYTRSE
jgi:predicted P-loop ATPase